MGIIISETQGFIVLFVCLFFFFSGYLVMLPATRTFMELCLNSSRRTSPSHDGR